MAFNKTQQGKWRGEGESLANRETYTKQTNLDTLFLPLEMEVVEKQININNFASGKIYTILFLE